jgi:hypothetical protein
MSRVTTCPGCQQDRDVDAQQGFVAAAARDGQSRDAEALRRVAFETSRSGSVPALWSWACDDCLDGGVARVADPLRQKCGARPPSLAYVDRPYTCADCGSPEVFEAGDQVHWYEALGFERDSHPLQCPRCRKVRRRVRKARVELLTALQSDLPAHPSSLDRIAKLAEAAAQPRSRANRFRRK